MAREGNILPARAMQVYTRFWSSETAVMSTMAVLVGLVTGLCALAFIWLIDNLKILFTGLSAVLAGVSPLAVVVVPAIGGLVAGPLIYFFAREAKGHGVPEVMYALVMRGGRIRPPVVVVKALASAMCISTGGSAGREGPIVQIGSALGSTLGQVFHLSDARIRNLVACGAAAGIAATFNAPIAGVAFALEVILAELQLSHFITVVIASVVASVVSRSVLGESTAFSVPVYTLRHPLEMLFYLLLGLLAALVARLFVVVLYRAEDLFDGWRFPEAFKPLVGGLLVGLLGLWAPQALGTGFATIEAALRGQLTLGILAVLVLAKILATSSTLGSGNSGGVFAPALFMGAMFGGAFGSLAHQAFPAIAGPAGAYALVGMAAVFAGAAHAPLTAMLIVFEMSGDYQLILPLMLATVVATLVSRRLKRESIYTIKLVKRGVDIYAGRNLNLMRTILVGEAMTPRERLQTVTPDMPLTEAAGILDQTHFHGLAVLDEAGELCGVVTLADLDRAGPQVVARGRVRDVYTTRIRTAFPDETLEDTLRHFGALDVGRIPVVDRANPKQLVGILRQSDIVRAYSQAYFEEQLRLAHLQRAQLEHRLGGQVVEIPLGDRDGAVGKPLSALCIPPNCVVASVRRGGRVLIPRGSTRLEAGDVIVALVNDDGEQQLIQCLAQGGVDTAATLGHNSRAATGPISPEQSTRRGELDGQENPDRG